MVKYLKKIGCLLFVMVLTGSVFASDYHFVVSAYGTGDFRTVQEAINAVPDFRKNETRIFIKSGIYKETILPKRKTVLEKKSGRLVQLHFLYLAMVFVPKISLSKIHQDR